MDERVIQFRVGVVVVAAIIITGVLIIFFGEGFRRQYTIFIRFPRAPGVSTDTPVRKHGVLIGRVVGVKLLEEGGAELTARIDRKYTLRTNDVCRISTASLLGDAVLDFVPSGVEVAAPQTIRDGDYLSGIVASDPLQVLVDMQGQMSSAIDSIEHAGNQVTLLAENLNAVVSTNEDQIQRIMQKTELALDGFRDTLGRLDGVLGDEELQAGIKKTFEDLPRFFEEAHQVLAEARNTLQGFHRVSQRAEGNLANLEKFTESLGESGPRLVEDLTGSVKTFGELLDHLVVFTQALSSEEGTLGKLISDPELYHQIDSIADNIEYLTRKMRPILDDVRIITDKIATDPRQLGVKGALDRRPSGFGLKHAVPKGW
jgi:phospholipid/cholesterol/gamma-HCH transport system substrate-binding protein